MGKPRDWDSLLAQRPKKKCCKKDPRCVKCPVVLHRLAKVTPAPAGPKRVKKALTQARRW